MSTAVVRREIELPVPAPVAWAYVTDWVRQGEWIPFTRVVALGPADRVGGRLRAWTGLGPVGFWDPMTISRWEVTEGGGRCEVRHTGKVVRGDAEFAVRARSDSTCLFLWEERLVLPGGRLGGLAWTVVGPVMGELVGWSLRRLAKAVTDPRRSASPS